MAIYEALWGNGNTRVEAGSLGIFRTREEAQQTVDAFLDRYASVPAVGAWVEEVEATYRCLACGREADRAPGEDMPRDDESCSHQWERV